MRFLPVWILIASIVILGCDEQTAPREQKPEPQASTTASTSRAPNYKGPPLRDTAVKSAPGDGGLVTMSRVLVPSLTPADPVTILLHWEDAAGPIDEKHALAKQNIDRAKTIESLRVKIAAADGAEKKLALNAPHAKSQLAAFGLDELLKIDEQGVAIGAQKFSWKDGAPSFAAGKYSIGIEGELAFADKRLRFESAPMNVEMRAPSGDFKSLTDLEAAAAAHVNATFGKKPAGASKQTLEDTEGNRVVRFTLDREMYQVLFVEVVLTPAGKVLGSAQADIFTCIAQGTLVATPHGARAIETLRRGDTVWSFDTAQQKRRLSQVVSLVALGERHTIELIVGLRLTAEHPVWVSGEWRNAQEIASGERLLGTAGALAATPRAGGTSLVYDLEVEAPHNFFAGGVLVHNKAAESPEQRKLRLDDWENVNTRP